MGIKINLLISQIIAIRSISINWPARFFINKGVKRGAMKVAMDVSVSERATLALAKYDMTFEANPQGMQPTKMMPADISDGKVKTFVRPHPTSGIIENWKNNE